MSCEPKRQEFEDGRPVPSPLQRKLARIDDIDFGITLVTGALIGMAIACIIFKLLGSEALCARIFG